MSKGTELRRGWGSFFGWAAVGIVALIGLLAAFVIPVFFGFMTIAGIGAWALSSRTGARIGWPGVLAGFALPLLYVAYLNHGGPGNVCTAHTGTACTASEEEWSPWPWLAAGLVLALAGVVAFLHNRRKEAKTR